jgi:hypothetical protein
MAAGQDPAEASGLLLKLTGLVPPGERHHREFRYDEIERRLPRDPEARVNVNLSELMPGQAGDVYTEPIGVVHRARNPYHDIPAAFVGFWMTAAGRPHLAPVGEPPWTPPGSVHPYLSGS